MAIAAGRLGRDGRDLAHGQLAIGGAGQVGAGQPLLELLVLQAERGGELAAGGLEGLARGEV